MKRQWRPAGMGHSIDQDGGEPAEGRVQAEVARRVDGVVIWIARHWLALFNALVALYLLLPFLAPALARAGLTTPASLLYSAYSATCHQLPERSYFLFGERPLYSLSALESTGLEEGQSFFQRRSFRGNEAAGYKIASSEMWLLCQSWWQAAFWPACRAKRSISLILSTLFGPMTFDGLNQLLDCARATVATYRPEGYLGAPRSGWRIVLEAAMREVCIRRNAFKVRNGGC